MLPTVLSGCLTRSNAKTIWANDHPMDSEKLLTRQAEMVLEADPGVPGQAPRVVRAPPCCVSLRLRYCAAPRACMHAQRDLRADCGWRSQWVYRNTIKALNWYGSVRKKLDDPAYSDW